MKRFLAILIGATSCSLCTYAQNGYIVTTTSQQTSISVESLEKQFINDHFKYYNLCGLDTRHEIHGDAGT